jgi:hypothetical protein
MSLSKIFKSYSQATHPLLKVEKDKKEEWRKVVSAAHPDKGGEEGLGIVSDLTKGRYGTTTFQEGFQKYQNRHKRYEVSIQMATARECQVFPHAVTIQESGKESSCYLGRYGRWEENQFVGEEFFYVPESSLEELEGRIKQSAIQPVKNMQGLLKQVRLDFKTDRLVLRIHRTKELYHFLGIGASDAKTILKPAGIPLLGRSSFDTPMLPGNVTMEGFEITIKNSAGETEFLNRKRVPNLMTKVLDQDYRLEKPDESEKKEYRGILLKMKVLELAVKSYNNEYLRVVLASLTQENEIETLASYFILFGMEDGFTFETIVSLEEELEFVKRVYASDPEFDRSSKRIQEILNDAVVLWYSLGILADKQADPQKVEGILKGISNYGYEQLYYSTLKHQKTMKIRDKALLGLGDMIQREGTAIHTGELLALTENGQLSGICSSEAVERFKNQIDLETRRYLELREFYGSIAKKINIEKNIEKYLEILLKAFILSVNEFPEIVNEFKESLDRIARYYPFLVEEKLTQINWDHGLVRDSLNDLSKKSRLYQALKGLADPEKNLSDLDLTMMLRWILLQSWHGEETTQFIIVTELGQIARTKKRIFEKLLSFLESEYPMAELEMVVKVLGEVRSIRSTEQRVLNDLLILLNKKKDDVVLCYEIAKALGKMGYWDERVIEILLEPNHVTLAQKREMRDSAKILANLGDNDKRVVELLLKNLTHTSSMRRCIAVIALGIWGRSENREIRGVSPQEVETIVTSLWDLMYDKIEEVSQSAIEALGSVGDSDPRVVPKLLEFTNYYQKQFGTAPFLNHPQLICQLI